jgi:beta-N-acetylhexosaminidase
VVVDLSAPPGELLIVGFEGLRAPDELLARVAAGRVGGVILFARNLGAPSEVASLVDAIGSAAPPGPPLMMAIDQEGGRVQRLKSPLTVWPPMATLAAHDDDALTEAVGRALGEELRLFGFNLDFAPVLDVRTNPSNQVIGDRAFGENPAAVEKQALAFWRGLEASGVRGCGKHFPGHGDTIQDSHLELPRIESSLAQLRKTELPPFEAAVRAGVPMIMTAHIVFPGVDERPATMSGKWIDGLLRDGMGFKGVVVSDDLDMKAVAGRFPVEEVVRDSLAAGVDCFLTCRDPEVQREAEEALVKAARDTTLGPRVTTALARVRTFRERLAPAHPVDAEQLARALPNADHIALAARI